MTKSLNKNSPKFAPIPITEPIQISANTNLFIHKNADQNFLNEVLENSGIKNPEIIKDAYGKPWLKNRELFFSKSHGGNLTVIAVSSHNIGVDVEKLTFRPRVVPHAFTAAEQDLLKKSPNKKSVFTRIWVIKEAHAKLRGLGVSYGLKNLDSLQLAPETDIIEYEDYLIAITKQ